MGKTLSVKEVAELAGYHPESVRYRVVKGYIEAKRNERGEYEIPTAELRKLMKRTKFQRVGGGE